MYSVMVLMSYSLQTDLTPAKVVMGVAKKVEWVTEVRVAGEVSVEAIHEAYLAVMRIQNTDEDKTETDED